MMSEVGEWTVTPVSDALVLLTAVAYLTALRRRRQDTRWPKWRTVCAMSGLVVIVLALNSAIGVYSGELHSVHMIQHLLLITVAPTLLALGYPLTLASESSAHSREIVALLRGNKAVAVLTHPLVAFACYAAVLVGTHLTGFLALVSTHPWLHDLEVALYLGSGYLFALPLLAWEPLRWQPPYLARFGLVLFSMTVDTFIGITLMMTGDTADMRLAGAFMWFVGDGLMMVVALVIAGQWMADPDRSSDTGAYLEAARRSALASYGDDADAVLNSPDIDEDEAARLAYNRMLAALARPHPRHSNEDR
jgi:putative membrane protein